jgi:hypothetical protein
MIVQCAVRVQLAALFIGVSLGCLFNGVFELRGGEEYKFLFRIHKFFCWSGLEKAGAKQ